MTLLSIFRNSLQLKMIKSLKIWHRVKLLCCCCRCCCCQCCCRHQRCRCRCCCCRCRCGHYFITGNHVAVVVVVVVAAVVVISLLVMVLLPLLLLFLCCCCFIKLLWLMFRVCRLSQAAKKSDDGFCFIFWKRGSD